MQVYIDWPGLKNSGYLSLHSEKKFGRTMAGWKSLLPQTKTVWLLKFLKERLVLGIPFVFRIGLVWLCRDYENLYSNKPHVSRISGRQEIRLGHSDSAKDEGLHQHRVPRERRIRG
eukprot:TRINITY_DN53722_c0_g2_i1.p1 TRINITY_DN53722_c0_g2~~TRINITY_DN53722_c0_g2_i1.p1  ORF type:complete len:116 (-),score=16.27 TRINITY_DN53722_c0_g2_i1:315-662(-)